MSLGALRDRIESELAGEVSASDPAVLAAIRTVEAEIRLLPLWLTETEAERETVQGERDYPLAGGWSVSDGEGGDEEAGLAAIRRLLIDRAGVRHELRHIGPGEMASVAAVLQSGQGDPAWWSVAPGPMGLSVRLWPIPAGVYTLTAEGTKIPRALIQSGDTNEILERGEKFFRCRVLREICSFHLDDRERAAWFAAEAERAWLELTRQSRRIQGTGRLQRCAL